MNQRSSEIDLRSSEMNQRTNFCYILKVKINVKIIKCKYNKHMFIFVNMKNLCSLFKK
jgi:hypothetical protein